MATVAQLTAFPRLEAPRWSALAAASLLTSSLAALVSCGSAGNAASSGLSQADLMDPKTCAGCHEQHYTEWSGSMHAYASEDPLFIALNQRAQVAVGARPGDSQLPGHVADATRLARPGQQLQQAQDEVDGLEVRSAGGLRSIKDIEQVVTLNGMMIR